MHQTIDHTLRTLMRASILASVLTGALSLPAHAFLMGEDAALSDTIARSPDLTLAALLPLAIEDGTNEAFRKVPSMVVNAEEGPFQASFEMSLPDYPNVFMTLLVSEDASLTSLVEQIFSMTSTGSFPWGAEADTGFPEPFNCVGDVRNLLISCQIGSAGLQFSAADILEAGAIDYQTTKSIFLTLPIDIYQGLFSAGE